MGDVTGPIFTLPGASHDLPESATCDQHPDRPAVCRVQGETDSMGSELNDMCEECAAEYRAWARSPEATTGRCDWCKVDATDLRHTRDYDEGLDGPVYEVCGACRKRRDERINAEIDEYDLDYPEDDYDPADDCGGYINGRFDWASCTQAGTEFCDFECPNGYAARAALRRKERRP